jgi:hypothetical protein
MSLGINPVRLSGPGASIGLASVRASKPPKPVGAPKIRQVHLIPADNGAMRAVHHLSTGKTKSFVFQNPKLMVQHLKRIEANEWLKPMQDPARRITSTLDIGAPA